jgi:methylamine dehydrogenase heavy chain
MMPSNIKKAAWTICLTWLTALNAGAELAAETYGQLTLDTLPQHTLLINTFSMNAVLYDADTQQMLGMISTGIGANAFEVDREKGVLHTAETYLSRHTRGARTDVISTYDIRTLSPIGEITIPPKHASGSPIRHYTGIVKDDQAELMLVTNITPAVSVSVADLQTGKFLSEIPTAGCGLVYPAEKLSFLQLCGNGSAQLITLNEKGEEQSRVRSEIFFDLETDPLMEKPARSDAGWVFNTFHGKVFLVSTVEGKIRVSSPFTVGSDEGDWRIGGMQPVAFHEPSQLLLFLMHQGGENTHKDPGTEIWYINLATGATAHRLALAVPANSIQVSQDESALLYAGSIAEDQVQIYDLKTTVSRGTISGVGLPTILQNL